MNKKEKMALKRATTGQKFCCVCGKAIPITQSKKEEPFGASYPYKYHGQYVCEKCAIRIVNDFSADNQPDDADYEREEDVRGIEWEEKQHHKR